MLPFSYSGAKSTLHGLFSKPGTGELPLLKLFMMHRAPFSMQPGCPILAGTSFTYPIRIRFGEPPCLAKPNANDAPVAELHRILSASVFSYGSVSRDAAHEQ